MSFIGYSSVEVTISEESPEERDFALAPSPVVMETILVTAEDPAIGIMREVIRRKQEWRKLLTSYRADAYSRVLLKRDSTIVSIAESLSEVFWEKDKGHNERVKTKRQTSNISAKENFAVSRTS